MLKTTLTLFTLCFSFIAHAEPELSGSPSELKPWLNGLQKTVSFTGYTKEELTMEKALVKLSVATEKKQLADALKDNLNIRKMVKQRLQDAGIDASQISESRFSSTPEYGFFDERPKSYKVENTLSIEITNENQMIEIASVSDELEEVIYLGSNAKAEATAEFRRMLIAKAIENAQKKAELFKSRLGVQLTVVEFEEHVKSYIPQSPTSTKRSSVASTFDSGSSAKSFGQTPYHATVTITYEVVR